MRSNEIEIFVIINFENNVFSQKELYFHEIKTKIALHFFKPTISYCRNVGLNCEPFKFTDNKYNFPGKNPSLNVFL